MAPFRVIMLPGSVLPAELAYGALVATLGSDAEVVAKDLEVYATAEAPSDYTLDLEVAATISTRCTTPFGRARSRTRRSPACCVRPMGVVGIDSTWSATRVVARRLWRSPLDIRSG